MRLQPASSTSVGLLFDMISVASHHRRHMVLASTICSLKKPLWTMCVLVNGGKRGYGDLHIQTFQHFYLNQTCFQVMGSSMPDNTDPSSCSMWLLKPSDGQTRVMVAFFFWRPGYAPIKPVKPVDDSYKLSLCSSISFRIQDGCHQEECRLFNSAGHLFNL